MSDGGFQESDQFAPLVFVAVKLCGGPGGPRGIALADGCEAALFPATFWATTVHAYAVPFASPDTSALVAAPGAVAVPAGEQEMAYPLSAAPPSSAGAVQLTRKVPPVFVETAETPTGGPGTVGMRTDPVLAAGPVPIAFTAATEKR